MFSPKDRDRIVSRGMTVETAEAQIELFKKGVPFIRLIRPCTVGDGIRVFSESDCDRLETLYMQSLEERTPIKFVPASGAATRMFQALLSVSSRYSGEDATTSVERKTIGDPELTQVHDLLTNLRSFAFYEDLFRQMNARGLDTDILAASGRFKPVLDCLLGPEGLHYANLPKALLKFHRYGNRSRTPVEEHIVEAMAYARDRNRECRIHFTISPEHEAGFRSLLDEIRPLYETGGNRLEIDLSFQSPCTDTLAVNPDNSPFHDPDGSLVFRPGGHGALLKNLDDLEGDIVFVKNIDNVVPDRLKPATFRFKKVLGGCLVGIQRRLFPMLDILAGESVRESDIDRAWAFAGEQFHIPFPEKIPRLSLTERKDLIYAILNRPLRVCGMVRNTGEPGGGPFWVHGPGNRTSLQIVESSQVDMHDPDQKSVWNSSTHFNPVDLVCGVRDHRGIPFDLSRFPDPDAGFISIKSRGGKNLKAMELPGLWNGAMAHWNTVFVEVPEITFNPVKTIFDLLRPNHMER